MSKDLIFCEKSKSKNFIEILINGSYKDKEKIKSLGGKWSPINKKWSFTIYDYKKYKYIHSFGFSPFLVLSSSIADSSKIATDEAENDIKLMNEVINGNIYFNYRNLTDADGSKIATEQPPQRTDKTLGGCYNTLLEKADQKENADQKTKADQKENAPINCRKCRNETKYKLSNYIKGFQDFILNNNPYFYCDSCILSDNQIETEKCLLCDSFIVSKLSFKNFIDTFDELGNRNFNGVKCLLCVSNEKIKEKGRK